MKIPFIHDDTRLVVDIRDGQVYFFMGVRRRAQTAIVSVKDGLSRNVEIPINGLNHKYYRFER
jgi:hypothetical protein